MSDVPRREFLTGAAAVAALGAARAAGAQEPPRELRRGTGGGSLIGPSNPAREAQNPDRMIPPATDHGTVPNLKWSFADSHNRIESGGWARQTTVRELHMSKEIAGVDMRLRPGSIREMHWHKQGEWGFVLEGKVRVTAVDQEGRTFQDDVGKHDLWFFPAGIPHSIQALGDEPGAEFLLVFDDGEFDENSTFLVSDWLIHTPKDVLAKNFGVPESTFDTLLHPKDLYMFPADPPPPLEQDRVKGAGPTPVSYSYRMSRHEPIATPGGKARVVDSKSFPASKTIAAALVEVAPGGLREMHWHPNAAEWQYYVSGRGRMTVFLANETAQTFDYQAGDVGYVPIAAGHYVQNTGDEPLVFLEVFRTDEFMDVSLRQWLAFTPHELVRAHVPGLTDAILDAIPARKTPIVPA